MAMTKDVSKILGLDPGLRTTGYGCIEAQGERYTFIEAGVILTPQDKPLAERLALIHKDIQQIIATLEPDLVSIEKIFFFKNITSGINVAQAMGVLTLACHQAGLPINEYPPLEVKMSLTGYGRATKHQIQTMVAQFLKLDKAPKPADAADALALALTHAFRL